MTYASNINQLISDEIDRREIGRSKAAWLNPCTARERDPVTGKMLEPMHVYLGEASPYSPTWDEPVLDLKAYMYASEKIAKGDWDADKKFSPWLNGWDDRLNEYLSEANVRVGGAATADDFSAINVVQVLAGLLGLEFRAHSVLNAVTRVNTPNLTINIDTWTKFTAWQDVDEGVTMPTKKGGYSRQTVNLLKDVGHVAFTDEVLLRPYEHNIYQNHLENVVNAMQQIKATKVITELETASTTAGADWGASSAGMSTNNPYDDIGAVIDLIEANNGVVDTIVTADRAFRDFISNSFVKGNGQAGAPANQAGARTIPNPPGLNGVTWDIDNGVTNTVAIVLDRSAVMLAQGPVRTAQYRDEQAGIDGYITRDWNAVKTVRSGFIRKLTGISG